MKLKVRDQYIWVLKEPFNLYAVIIFDKYLTYKKIIILSLTHCVLQITNK